MGTEGGDEPKLPQINSVRPVETAMVILQWCQVLSWIFPANHRANPVPSSEDRDPQTGSALNAE